jgi:hypothetical protein
LGHGGLTGLDRAGGGLGIGRVGLAAAAAGLAVGPVDLHHDLAVGGQKAGQGGTVGAGAFHAPGVGLTEPAGPGEQVLIAGGRGGDAAGADATAELVVGVGDMAVQVGVDPHGDRLGCSGLCHAGDGRLLSLAGQGMARAPAGRTAL